MKPPALHFAYVAKLLGGELGGKKRAHSINNSLTLWAPLFVLNYSSSSGLSKK